MVVWYTGEKEARRKTTTHTRTHTWTLSVKQICFIDSHLDSLRCGSSLYHRTIFSVLCVQCMCVRVHVFIFPVCCTRQELKDAFLLLFRTHFLTSLHRSFKSFVCNCIWFVVYFILFLSFLLLFVRIKLHTKTGQSWICETMSHGFLCVSIILYCVIPIRQINCICLFDVSMCQMEKALFSFSIESTHEF